MITPQPETLDLLLDELTQRARLPRATYRVQFSPSFTFQHAHAIVDYLDALGISDLYASPVFKPRSGSTHGYDTVDYNAFNDALGGEDDFNALSETLRSTGLGLLLDIVPNHMGVNTENAWWMDVLKQGASSDYAQYFDISWFSANRQLDNKLLLPVLGDHFGRVLEAGELDVVYWHGDFYLHYYEHQFPLTPETYGAILRLIHDALVAGGDYEEWVALELASVIHSLDFLPPYTTQDPDEVITRQREQTIVRWRLLGLFDKSEVFRTAVDEGLRALNGTAGDSISFDALAELLERQPYRLAYWRVATDEINYRRFFDINDMAAIRIENPRVFADTHRMALRLLAEGKATGVRIDHPDGLWDPESYFQQLQEAYLTACIEQHIGEHPRTSSAIADRMRATLRASNGSQPEWALYVVVEKILSASEPLPYTWAVYGTTGYDFMYVVNNLFVDNANEAAFNALYADFIGENIEFNTLTDTTKKLVMTQALTSEIDARSAELRRIIERNRRSRGYTQNVLAFGLSEIIAALSVYRTYITGAGLISERDRHYIDAAVALAKKRNPLRMLEVFDFLRDLLLTENWHEFSEELRPLLREFLMKFQQITGPVMAKSVEDTAFYIYNRLVSLNEVGGHPEHFGMTCTNFHTHHAEIAFPYSMLSTATHDTKRGEDVRARINVLSEIPTEWASMIDEWAALNDNAKVTVNETPAPSRNDEYLIYQTLIGTYEADADPEIYRRRIIAYMHKAMNEAKVHSSWINPNQGYGSAIEAFITRSLTNEAFMASFTPFQARISYFGWFNSLAQTLLKLTAPGIPDIYQGTELWDYSLVDPDNRRPVDFERRRNLLSEIQARESHRAALADALLADLPSGAIKLYTLYRALSFRREHEELFLDGAYAPVISDSEHACAFLRSTDDETALIVVPRLVATLTKGEMQPPIGAMWGDAALKLPAALKQLENVFTGERLKIDQGVLPLARALEHFPIGLFVRVDA